MSHAWLSGPAMYQEKYPHIPSTAFRHLPPRKDVNRCLEFDPALSVLRRRAGYERCGGYKMDTHTPSMMSALRHAIQICNTEDVALDASYLFRVLINRFSATEVVRHSTGDSVISVYSTCQRPRMTRQRVR